MFAAKSDVGPALRAPSIRPSPCRKPSASSSSWPGVRIVTASGSPSTRISSGSSIATSSRPRSWRTRMYMLCLAKCLARPRRRGAHLALGLPERLAVPDREQARVRFDERLRRLHVPPGVPRGEERERKPEREVAADRCAAKRLEDVAGDQAAVPAVEEGDVA